MTNKPYTIVSFDGGGIRGLISALLLQQLQTDVYNQTNQQLNFLANTSMFAGTSTGSFLALAMAQDPSSDNVGNIVSLYEKDGPIIFTPFQPPSSEAARVPASAAFENAPQPTGAAASLGNWGDILTDEATWQSLFYVRYNNTQLQQRLHDQFKDTTIGELKPDILVNTLQLWNGAMWSPVEITKSSASTSAMTLVDAALCSSAAPTYFPPFSPSSNASLGYCVDGGAFASNPSVTALMSALAAGQSDIALLSFGTGLVPEGINTVGDATKWGTLQWFLPKAVPPQPPMPLLAAMMDGSSELADKQSRQLLRNAYQRLNPTLSQPIALDGITPADMQAMQDAANSVIQSDSWSDIVTWVIANFQTSTVA